MLPPGATTNVSLLSAAPTRFSKPLKPRPPTTPAPEPVTFQMLSAPGPWRVSASPPAEIAATDGSEMEAIPPPVTETPEPSKL